MEADSIRRSLHDELDAQNSTIQYESPADFSIRRPPEDLRTSPSPTITPRSQDRQRPLQLDEQDEKFIEGVDWAAVNRLLRENGFAAIPFLPGDYDCLRQMPSEKLLRSAFARSIMQFARRGRLVQDLVSVASTAKAEAERAWTASQAAQQEAEVLRTAAVNSDEKARVADEQKMIAARAQNDEIQRLERELSGLKQKYATLEHVNRQRERDVQRLQERLADVVAKDDKRVERQREVFRQLQHRDVRSRAFNDTKTAEIIGAYEAQRESMQMEIDTLRRETRQLQDELRFREGDEGSVRASQSRENAETQRLRDEAAAKISRYETQLREASSRAANSRAEADDLARNNKALAARVRALESALARQMDRPLQLSPEPTSPPANTRESIRRDKAVHQLGLQRIVALPHDVCVRHLQDACVAVNITDVWQLAPTLTKMTAVVSAVPKLEQFVRTVCSITETGPEVALELLQSWADERQLERDLNTAMHQITDLLAQRVGGERLPPTSLVPAVKDLIAAERRLLALESSAATVLQLDGDGVSGHGSASAAVIRHFMQLFDVREPAGVLPRMNEVFLTVSEAGNAFRAIRSVLGLDAAASPTAVVTAVRALADERYAQSLQ